MASKVSVRFLGTGSILCDATRSCTAILIETSKEKILVDAGPGTLLRLKECNVSPEELTYIFITHFHPDHVSDLVSILFAIRNSHLDKGSYSLRVWGPRGFINYLHGLKVSYGKWLDSLNDSVKFYELKRRLMDFPGFRLIWGKVLHKTESVGYRFEFDRKVICVSGDTGYCSELTRLCRDGDLTIMECSFPDELAVEGHLSPSLAGKIAQDAQAKKLILTHFYPGTDKSNLVEVAQKFYNGPVELAEDRKLVEL